MAATLQHRMAMALAVLTRTDSLTACSNTLHQLETQSTVNVLADLQRRGALDDDDATVLLDTAPLPGVVDGLRKHHDIDLWWVAQALRHLLDACALLQAHEAVALSPVSPECLHAPPDGQHAAVQGACATAASLLAGLQAAAARRSLLCVALSRVANVLQDALSRVEQASLRGWLVKTAILVMTRSCDVAHHVPEAVLTSAASVRRLDDGGEDVDHEVPTNIDQATAHVDQATTNEPVLWLFRRIIPQLEGALPPEDPTAEVLDDWSFRLELTDCLEPYTGASFPATAHWRCD